MFRALSHNVFFGFFNFESGAYLNGSFVHCHLFYLFLSGIVISSICRDRDGGFHMRILGT